jgi:tetratricopeptide (TPR) repeat protein
VNKLDISHILFLVEAILTVLTVIVIVFGIIELRARRRKNKVFYSVIWKKASALKPAQILGARPFHEYYYQRPEDALIARSLEEKKNLLVVGSPLSGKSRAVFEGLIHSPVGYDVIVPRCVDIDPKEFGLPRHVRFWRQRILVLDDLHRFIEQQNFDSIFRISLEKKVAIIATCRSGIDYTRVKNKLLEKNLSFETIFNGDIFQLKKVPREVGKEIAERVGIDWDRVKFDGNIGSIVLPLGEMEKRFDECDNQSKTILRAIKILDRCGMYKENRMFPKEWIKIIVQKSGLTGKPFEWTAWFENLRDKEFIELARDAVWAEESYLDTSVKFDADLSDFDIFDEAIRTFSAEPDALSKAGHRAYEVGGISVEKARFMKIAIKAFEQTLKIHTVELFPEQYGITEISLGNAFRQLSEVEEKADNCRRAIGACERALSVFTLERFPKYYAMVQNNLGNAYGTLAEVETNEDNCRRAIASFEEALKVRTFEQFPVDYAMTENNLGSAYIGLAEVEAKADNCRRAIGACERALKVFTIERYPVQFGATEHNLGQAYDMLAEVEAKADNCRRAVAAFEEALKVYTLERYPLQFALIQNDQGKTYSALAEVEATADNCQRATTAYEEAVASYEKALSVYTEDKFPELHRSVTAKLKEIRNFCEGKK